MRARAVNANSWATFHAASGNAMFFDGTCADGIGGFAGPTRSLGVAWGLWDEPLLEYATITATMPAINTSPETHGSSFLRRLELTSRLGLSITAIVS